MSELFDSYDDLVRSEAPTDLTKITGIKEAETEKAVLIAIPDKRKTLWIPKSLIHRFIDDRKSETIICHVETWFLTKNGVV